MHSAICWIVLSAVPFVQPAPGASYQSCRDGFSYFDLGGGGCGKIFWGGGAFSSKLIQLRLNSIYNSEFRYNWRGAETF